METTKVLLGIKSRHRKVRSWRFIHEKFFRSVKLQPIVGGKQTIRAGEILLRLGIKVPLGGPTGSIATVERL